MKKNLSIITAYLLALLFFTIGCNKGTEPPQVSVPILTTTEATNITSSAALSGGNITSDGGAAITARGVCWSTNATPTISDSRTTDGTGIGSFTSTIMGLDSNTTYNVRAYATNSAGTGYGNEVTFTTASGSNDTVTDIDGNVYHTVTIGSQVWMVENLKTTRYNDGQSIPNVTNDNSWYNLRTPGYCWYNNDISNKEICGALYNWFAVNTGRLAPSGWHVPSREEWNTLINYLGGENIAGGKLKETGTAHWLAPNEGATNETGFTARGVGIRDVTFMMILETNYNWSSTSDATDNSGAFQVHLYCGTPWANLYSMQKFSGFTVRCIRN